MTSSTVPRVSPQSPHQRDSGNRARYNSVRNVIGRPRISRRSGFRYHSRSTKPRPAATTTITTPTATYSTTSDMANPTLAIRP
jgi:hypothetical protein